MQLTTALILTSTLFAGTAGARQGEPPRIDFSTPADEAAPDVDVPARIYVNRCTGCHTIGRGALTGPDLLSSTGWPAPDLRIGIEKMQEKSGPMAQAEIDGLVEFLKGPDIATRIAAEEARIALQYAAKLQPASAETGARLYAGHLRFDNGGMACVACHRVGDGAGGLLGPDLAGVFSRTGETGLRSACEKAAFKVMAAAYREHPVTRQEAMHLTAYFAHVEQAQPSARRTSAPPFVLAGTSLAVLVFLLTLFALRNRHRSVRHSLTRSSS